MSHFTPKQLIINSMGLIVIIINLAFMLDFTQNQGIKQLSDKDLFKTLMKIARKINENMPIVIERV